MSLTTATTTPSGKEAAMGSFDRVELARSALLAAFMRDVITLGPEVDTDDRPIRLRFHSDDTTDPPSVRVIFLDYGISVGLPDLDLR